MAVYWILLILIGSGRHIEELREIIQDEGLRKLTGLNEIPSPSPGSRGQGSGEGLNKFNQVL